MNPISDISKCQCDLENTQDTYCLKGDGRSNRRTDMGTIKRKLFLSFLLHSALVASLLGNKEKTFLTFSASFCLGGQFIGQ